MTNLKFIELREKSRVENIVEMVIRYGSLEILIEILEINEIRALLGMLQNCVRDGKIFLEKWEKTEIKWIKKKEKGEGNGQTGI